MCKLWKKVMKNRPKIFFEPDYMIRNGPICRAGSFCQVATLARLSCNYTKLMFLAFNQGAEISVSKRQTEGSQQDWEKLSLTMVLPSQGAQAKPGVTRELRKSSWRTWPDGLPCEQGGFSFEWPAFNIYEVVRAVCQSRLTDKRRERLPNTLKAMQKRNLSAGKVEWAGFLNEVQSVSIRPSPNFFFIFIYLFFLLFFFIQ